MVGVFRFGSPCLPTGWAGSVCDALGLGADFDLAQAPDLDGHRHLLEDPTLLKHLLQPLAQRVDTGDVLFIQGGVPFASPQPHGGRCFLFFVLSDAGVVDKGVRYTPPRLCLRLACVFQRMQRQAVRDVILALALRCVTAYHGGVAYEDLPIPKPCADLLKTFGARWGNLEERMLKGELDGVRLGQFADQRNALHGKLVTYAEQEGARGSPSNGK